MAQPEDLVTAPGGARAAPDMAQTVPLSAASARGVPVEEPVRLNTAPQRTMSTGEPAPGMESPRTTSSGEPSSPTPPRDVARGTSAATTVDAQRLAERAVEALFAHDMASRMLGMRVVGVKPGHARLAMTVRPDMVNGHRI